MVKYTFDCVQWSPKLSSGPSVLIQVADSQPGECVYEALAVSFGPRLQNTVFIAYRIGSMWDWPSVYCSVQSNMLHTGFTFSNENALKVT